MTTAFIGIGSNVTDSFGVLPLGQCQLSVQAIITRLDAKLVRLSSWYRSAPVPASAQPDYVNGVLWAEVAAEPLEVLAALNLIEAEAGRTRSVPNAARTLDLDLLDMGGAVLTGGRLILPHPRLHQRAFVLRPLAEIAPEWRHPLLGETAASLCRGVADQDAERIALAAGDSRA